MGTTTVTLDPPTTPERVQKLKAEADNLDRRADHLMSMRGRSPMFKWTDVWRAREQAKKLRAEAVRRVLAGAL